MEEKQKETVEKIGSIKEHLAHTDTEQLMEFVQAYESDSRAGVQKLVETARKRFDKLQQEKIRTESLKKYEKEYDNYTYICGIDEVGRGPLAGPVVAAAVILPKLLNDAVTIPKVEIRQVPIIKGDAKSISIGAASIIAKVTRDRLMENYEDIYPGYGFAANKGYGSAEHIAALKKLGPTLIHRATVITK